MKCKYNCIYFHEIPNINMQGKTVISPYCDYKDKFLHEIKSEEKESCLFGKTTEDLDWS